MKRILAIVLLAALCLSLVACGSKVSILGEWKTDNDKYVMTLEKDGKGTMKMDDETYDCTWEFDMQSRAVAITVNGNTEIGTYMESSDTLYVDSLKFVRVK